MGPNSKWHKRTVVVLLIIALCCVAHFIWIFRQKTGAEDTQKTISEQLEKTNGEESLVDANKESGSNNGTSGAKQIIESKEAHVSSWIVDGNVSEVAKIQLEGYKNSDNCVLLYSEYLDLFGNSWFCIIQGPTWVESCYVTAKRNNSDSSMSEVKLVHMDANSWREDAEKTFGEAR